MLVVAGLNYHTHLSITQKLAVVVVEPSAHIEKTDVVDDRGVRLTGGCN